MVLVGTHAEDVKKGKPALMYRRFVLRIRMFRKICYYVVPARCYSIALHNNTKQSEGENKMSVFQKCHCLKIMTETIY